MKRDRPLHIAFAPSMVAGLRTQWDNMRQHLVKRSDICAHIAAIDPYKPDGRLEASPLPRVVSGNLRSMLCASTLLRPPRLDALWIYDIRSALPFIVSKGRFQHTVIVFATDATSKQIANFGGLYTNKSANDSLRGRLRDALDTFCLNRATVLQPWSAWAASSLRQDFGIDAGKIQVLPPGIDLERWPLLARQRSGAEPVRLLFVGGDFARKGGDLLLDVFTRRFQDRCELHLVTRDEVPARPGVHIYRDFSPNDPALRDLYARCDVFVLPTRADCFSLASMEAMATGLPVITTAVGGIPEVVSDGRSGFLIAPDDGAALARRLETLVASEERRIQMGREGRHIVETRFDAARNTTLLLDTIVDLCRRRETASANPTAHQRSA